MLIRPIVFTAPQPARGLNPMRERALEKKLAAGIDRSQAEAELVAADRATWGIGRAETRQEVWQAYADEFATGEAGPIFVQMVARELNVEWAGRIAHAAGDPDRATTLAQRTAFMEGVLNRPVCQYHANKVTALQLFRSESARTTPETAADLLNRFLDGVERPGICEQALADFTALDLATRPDRRERYLGLLSRGYSAEWPAKLLQEMEKPIGASTLEQRHGFLDQLAALKITGPHVEKLECFAAVAERVSQAGVSFENASQDVLAFVTRFQERGGSKSGEYRSLGLWDPERRELFFAALEHGFSSAYAAQALPVLETPLAGCSGFEQLAALTRLKAGHPQPMQLHRNRLAALDALRGRISAGLSPGEAEAEVSDLVARLQLTGERVEHCLAATTTPTSEPMRVRFSSWLADGLEPLAAGIGMTYLRSDGKDRLPGQATAFVSLMQGRNPDSEIRPLASAYARLLERGVPPEQAADLLSRNLSAAVTGALDEVLATTLEPPASGVKLRADHVEVGGVRLRRRG